MISINNNTTSCVSFAMKIVKKLKKIKNLIPKTTRTIISSKNNKNNNNNNIIITMMNTAQFLFAIFQIIVLMTMIVIVWILMILVSVHAIAILGNIMIELLLRILISKWKTNIYIGDYFCFENQKQYIYNITKIITIICMKKS